MVVHDVTPAAGSFIKLALAPTWRTPFLFLSSYARDQLRADFQDTPRLSKPVEVSVLRSKLGEMIDAPETVGHAFHRTSPNPLRS